MFLCLSLSSEPWARCRAGKKMTSTMHLDNHDIFLLAKIKYGCSTWIVNEKDKTVEHLLILLEVRFIFSLYFLVWGGWCLFQKQPFIIMVVWKVHYGWWRFWIFLERRLISGKKKKSVGNHHVYWSVFFFSPTTF